MAAPLTAQPPQAQMRGPCRNRPETHYMALIIPLDVGRVAVASFGAIPTPLRGRPAHLRLRGLCGSTTPTVRELKATVLLRSSVERPAAASSLTVGVALNSSGYLARAEGDNCAGLSYAALQTATHSRRRACSAPWPLAVPFRVCPALTEANSLLSGP